MKMGPRLDLRQSQSLVMTPQLQQAIRLLALSNLEIESFIAEELDKNPLLEMGRDESGGERGETGSGDDAGSGEGDFRDGGDDASPEPETADRLMEHGATDSDAPLDVDYDAETFMHDTPADRMGGLDGSLSMDGGGSGGTGGGDEGIDFDSFAAAGLSLHDHLIAQAGLSVAEPLLGVVRALIDQIDETGYFSGGLLDLAHRLGVPLVTVEAALRAVQGFDPAGVGARSLAECLALQARDADRYDPAMARLIDNLDLLAGGKLNQLKRICGVDEEDIGDMIRELRGYDPKPGLRFSRERAQPVTPDIFVARIRDGWAIELNNASLPRVLVNRGYYAELSGGSQDKASKAWLSDCLTSANWLVKALDQRARTIVKVATEIVKQQEGFFLHGVEQLRPLTLKTVAEAVEMHESTISRVTSNKYLSCAHGMFELKYFFTSGIASSEGGEAMSAEAVKSHIRALIMAEDPKSILSDDTLVDLLRARGFDIARRTVAKYRESLGLGSSVQRRRQKALLARAS